jgi:hypothetical protein
VFGYPDGSVLIALIPSKFLVKPRMSVSAKPKTPLRLPLFDGTNQALNAVLASIREVFFVLDDLTDFTDERKVMANHSVKAIIFIDAVRPAVVE